jgi:hypothetical protein
MARASARAAIFLTGAGLILVLAGALGAAIGILIPDRIHALLPPLAPDVAAIGGAIVALGVMLIGLGGLHLAVATGLRRGSSFGSVAAASLGMLMAVICLGSAASAAVSLAAGSAPALALVPATVGLALLAGAYAWVSATVIGLRREGSA